MIVGFLHVFTRIETLRNIERRACYARRSLDFRVTLVAMLAIYFSQSLPKGLWMSERATSGTHLLIDPPDAYAGEES